MTILLILSLFVCNCALLYAQGHNTLALQWPPGVCLAENCDRPAPRMFTIHGYWPPQTGSGEPIVVQEAALVAMMTCFWPSLAGKTDQLFWSQEWTEHGIASGLNMREYFYFVLDLYFDLKTARKLQDSPLVKEQGLVLYLFYVQEEMNKIAGTEDNPLTTQLICTPRIVPPYPGEVFVLTEIRFCFTAQNVIMACPSPLQGCEDTSIEDPQATFIYIA